MKCIKLFLMESTKKMVMEIILEQFGRMVIHIKWIDVNQRKIFIKVYKRFYLQLFQIKKMKNY